jgi:hypothetical protein
MHALKLCLERRCPLAKLNNMVQELGDDGDYDGCVIIATKGRSIALMTTAGQPFPQRNQDEWRMNMYTLLSTPLPSLAFPAESKKTGES